MTTLSPSEVQHACSLLSAPALMRLITEIDDNGPIPSRGLGRTLADLPAQHLRHTAEQARALGLVRHRPGVGLTLTTSGSHLADLYDAMARWARRHAYPAPVCDFTSRIQHTLALLADPPVPVSQADAQAHAAGSPTSAEATEDALAGPRDLLHEWLHTNPQVIPDVDHELAA
ncbi:hypothetical protein [Streptomyces diastatochromogenes]|uniref:HTH hxlR-type domain-containing protein n=1 Tax=Streptomyces diastatochromogenes TaxID=42236 RepID=A0A233SCR3_STRDA|nr:hypothetical protein [Streptomyces diastatochromogenes]MCZ0990363.1 hypothetical protein [Streptomyces diastatochromogenes]OXY93454.1 hypothetical protein BEK98_22340 [Streptomyces diastatochromogenes]